MRTLTHREKLAVRYGALAIAIYLAAFYGFNGWKVLEQKRAAYQELVEQAQNLKSKVEPYQAKVLVTGKLMREFRLDPAKLSRATVVAQASAAIQDEAKSDGIKLGTLRESGSQPSSSKELASMQVEGTGPIPAMLKLLGRLNTLGYPLVIDSVQLTPESSRPGQIKLNLTIVILDFDQWKAKEPDHA